MLNQNFVVGDAQEHGVVDDAAVLVAEDDVAGTHVWHQGVHVASDEVVDELSGFGDP